MPPLTRGAAGPNNAGIRRRGIRSERCVVSGHGARAAEVRVRVVDAGVDHGDLDVLAVQARGSATRWARRSAGCRSCCVGRISCSGRTATTPGNAASAAALSRAIRTLMPLYDDWYVLTTVPPSASILLLSAFLRILERILGRVLLGLAELAAGGFLLDRYGIAAHLHDDIDGLLAKTDRRERRSDEGRAVRYRLRTHWHSYWSRSAHRAPLPSRHTCE